MLETDIEIIAELKEDVEIVPGFIVDAYRLINDIDRSIYGEFWISPQSASKLAAFSEGWLSSILALGENEKKSLKRLYRLGFSARQILVKIVGHPKQRSAKPISLSDVPPIIQYASIYGSSIEQRSHASSMLMAGNLGYLKSRLHKIWNIETTNEEDQEEFAKSYNYYKKVLQSLSDFYPILSKSLIVKESNELAISSPLKSYYSQVKGRKLRARYRESMNTGIKLYDLKKEIRSLSTYIEEWKIVTRKVLEKEYGNEKFSKYPEFAIFIPTKIDGKNEECLFLFEFSNLIVEHKFVENVLGRRYLKFSRDTLNLKYVFQIFVAPLGATPESETYIRKMTMNEERGCVGVMTTKEFLNTLTQQAYKTKKCQPARGEVKDVYSHLDYKIPKSLNEFAKTSTDLPLFPQGW